MTAAAAALLVVVAASRAAALDFVYVAANEGGSSGGHVALRDGDTIFHYVHRDGLVRLAREPDAPFLERYRLLENRSIQVTPLAADATAARRARAVFARRWVAESRRFATAGALEADRRLLDAVRSARRGRGAPTFPVAGLGYFALTDSDEASPASEPAVARARELVGRAYGVRFIVRERADAREALARLPPPAAHDTDVPAASAGPPARSYGLARRYGDLAARVAAFDVLDRATPLRADGMRDTGLPLGRDERTAIAELERRLEERVLALLVSTRPDRGAALAVTLARLAALERSRRAGRWILLDVLPDDGDGLDAAWVARHRDAVGAMVAADAARLTRARRGFVAAGRHGAMDERALGRLEHAANRLLEGQAALAGGRGLRVAAGPTVPSRALAVRPVLAWPDAALDRALADARRRERRHADRLRSLHGYDLVRRNCVTELLRTLNEALPIEQSPLDFVPALASARIDRRHAAAAPDDLPSRRRIALAALRSREPRLVMALRESNVVTATAYRRNPDDSLFLFFTDGAAAPRPLLGAANLGVGIGAAVAGLATLPADRGHLLWAGLRGALFSLPELAFVNLRKGTYDRSPDPR